MPFVDSFIAINLLLSLYVITGTKLYYLPEGLTFSSMTSIIKSFWIIVFAKSGFIYYQIDKTIFTGESLNIFKYFDYPGLKSCLADIK